MKHDERCEAVLRPYFANHGECMCASRAYAADPYEDTEPEGAEEEDWLHWIGWG